MLLEQVCLTANKEWAWVFDPQAKYYMYNYMSIYILHRFMQAGAATH